MSTPRISHIQQNQSDFYESKLMNSKSKKEFLKEYEKFNEQDARIFYLQVLTEIENSVIDGNVDKLKRLSNVISYVSCMRKSAIKNYFNDDSNPLKTTNLVILACKSNQVCVLQNIFSSDDKILSNLSTHSGRNLSPADEDETCHNAFYYAIRSNNVELLYTLLNWPGNFFDTHLDDWDRIISTSYEELKLKNVPLTDKMEFLVEKKILSLRFYSNSSEEDHETDLNNIKNRIELVLENIVLLKNDSLNTKVDESFIFIAKFVAQNIHVLKRQLKATYDRLPWEEMEFCLVCFVSSYLKQQEINLFFASTLDKRKILYHLEIFANELEKVRRSFLGVRINDLGKLPKLNREEVFTNITNINPQFEELYRDYHQIRDIYSLEKINTYVNLALPTDTGKREGQLIIMRTLQVIGEHLKNTLESPKLSDATSDLILLSITRNTRKKIINLRNSLSHTHSLFTRIEIELNSDVNFFTGVQNDIKKVGDVISDILSNKKIKMIRELLEKIVSAENFDEIKRVVEIFNNAALEDNIKQDFKMTEHLKLQKLIKELSECMPTEASRNEELFERINSLLNSSETKSQSMQISYNLGFLKIKKLKFWMSQIVDHNVIREIKLQGERTLENMIPTMDCHILKQIADLSMEILTNVKSKMNPDNIEEMERILREIFYIAEYGTDSFEWIEELRKNFYQNKDTNFTHTERNIYNITKENYKILESRLIELKDILNSNLLSGKLMEKVALYENDKSLQAVIEMLVLDILDILNPKLEKNYLFLDDNYILLTGRCLRNYLAHDNILVTLFNDPSKIVLLNARKLTEENIMKSKKKLGKLVKDDPLRLREKYKKNLEIIIYQRRMFTALKDGDIENLNVCFRKGTDVSARNVNSWTTLHSVVLEKLKTVEDIDTMKAIMCACNEEQKKLTAFAIQQNFSNIDQLKEVLQHGPSDLVKEVLQLVIDDGNYQKALDILNEVFEKKKIVLGPDNPSTLKIERHIALIFYKLGKYHKALSMLEKVFLKQKHVLGSDNNDSLSTRSSIALLLHRLGRDEEAYNIFQEVYGKQREILGPNHENTLETLFDFGSVLTAQGKHEEALDIYKADFERWKERTGPYSQKALKAQNNIAMVLSNQGKYEEALKIYKEVLEKKTIVLGTNHPDTLRTLQSIGIIFSEQKKYPEALQTFQSLLTVQKSELGHDHPETLRTQYTLLVELFNQGKYVGVLKVYNECFEKIEALFGSFHFLVLDILDKMEIVRVIFKLDDYRAEQMLLQVQKNFITAVKDSDVKTVQSLLNYGVDVNGKDSDGKAPLHHTAHNGNINVMNMLLENGADVNAKDSLGWTPLHYAVVSGENHVVNLLLENGAVVTQITNKGNTPLHIAALHNNKEIVEILLNHVRSVKLEEFINAKTTSKGNTALHVATKNGSLEIVQTLLNHGAIYEIENQASMKPLDISTNCTVTNLLSLLEELFEFAKEGNEEMIKKLTAVDTDKLFAIKNATNNEGYKLLRVAINNGHKKMVYKLIELFGNKSKN